MLVRDLRLPYILNRSMSDVFWAVDYTIVLDDGEIVAWENADCTGKRLVLAEYDGEPQLISDPEFVRRVVLETWQASIRLAIARWEEKIGGPRPNGSFVEGEWILEIDMLEARWAAQVAQ